MMFDKKIEERIKNAKKYDVDFKKGLSSEQVQQRYKEGLINKKTGSTLKSYPRIIIENLFNFLNINLLLNAFILLKFKLYNRLYFLFAFVSNFLTILFYDLKARKIISNVSFIANKTVTVMRDGIEKNIAFNELVFSDIILLKKGDIVPCDSEIVHGNIFVNESFLTGETNDIKKNKGSKLLARSFIVNGTCYAKIIGILNTSYIMKIQEKLHSFTKPKSQIIKFLNNIIFVDTFVALLINLIKLFFFVKQNGWNFNRTFVDSVTSSFLSMLSVGMYLMISIILTMNVVSLYLDNKVLVNEPYSIDMLARTNLICFDKTGTLTTGLMEVHKIIPIGNNNLEFLRKIIAQIIFFNEDDNFTAKALKKCFIFHESFKVKQYSNIPFNSKNKYSAISYGHHTYVLGAFDFIKVDNFEVKEIIDFYEKKGFRVLIVAENDNEILNNKIFGNFKVIGILVLFEEIRSNIFESINEIKRNNIDVCIISGDSEFFLNAIAKKIGLDSKVISLRNLDIAQIKNIINQYRIFARVTPEQKKYIIDEFKKQNKVVTMIGDGINDLLALKSAHCSIAISNDDNLITKSISNIVLLNVDFLNIQGLIEISKKNINKIRNICILFLTKTMFLLILNFVFFVFNKDFPFRVNNFFAWEIISIAVAPFFLSLEKNNETIIENSFAKSVLCKLIPAVFIQLSGCLFIFLWQKQITKELISLSTIFISFMSLIFLIHTYFSITKIRVFIFSSAILSMFLVFVIDFIFCQKIRGFNFLNVDYSVLNQKNIFLLFILILSLGFLYFFIVKIWQLITNKFFINKK